MICKTGNIKNMDMPCVYAILQCDLLEENRIVDIVGCMLIEGDVEIICDEETHRDRIFCNQYQPVEKPKQKTKKKKRKKNVEPATPEK